MPIVSLNNAEIFYEVKGAGPPIVFTHGHSMNHQQWEPQVKALSEDFQIITWDVRGHGSSTLPNGKVDPRDFSKDLHDLLSYLKVDKALICGLSMGGHISLQTAAYYPKKVSGLILIGTPFTNTFNWFEKYGARIGLLFLRILPYKWTAEITATTMSKVNSQNKSYVMESFNQMTKSTFLRHWSGNLKLESKELLPLITCPTLILHGDRDKLVARQQEVLRSSISQADFKTITNADHLTNRDNPKKVTEAIQAFFHSYSSKL